MSVVAIGVAAAGAAVAAAGSIASSSIAADAAGKAAGEARNAPVPSYNPSADPLLAGISSEALLGLGQPTGTVTQQADPMAQVINIANQSGKFSRNEIGAIQLLLPSLYKYGEVVTVTANSDDQRQGVGALQKALALAGYSSPQEFYQKSQEYNKQQAEYEAQLGPVRNQVLQGRLAAYSNISKLAQDFPTATAADITALQKQYEDQIRASINQDTADSQNQILQAANMARGNPAATLGRLAQQRLLSQQAAPTSALERALQMLQGRQTLGTGALAAYQSVLDPGNALAYNVAQLRVNSAQQAAQLMAGNQQNATNTQTALMNAQGQATANGVATAANSVASGGSSAINAYQNAKLLAAIGGPAGSLNSSGSEINGITNRTW